MQTCGSGMDVNTFRRWSLHRGYAGGLCLWLLPPFSLSPVHAASMRNSSQFGVKSSCANLGAFRGLRKSD